MIHLIYNYTFLKFLLITNTTDRYIVDNRIQLILQFINQNLQQELGLEEVAVQINLSPEHTLHLFAEQVGIPYSRYIIWQRIMKIIAVAIHEKGKLSEVCMRYGFVDQLHFNKIFKRIFGLVPLSLIYHCRVLL